MPKKNDALKQADAIFDQVMTNPKDPNARVIAARRGNKAKKFDSADMIRRAKNAGKRLRHAEEAIEQMEPALERFQD